MKFTDKTIRGLKPLALTYEKLERDGFKIRVYPTGRKVFRYTYKINGKTKHLTLGSYGDISLSEARQRHRDALSLRQEGIDPAEKKKAVQADSLDALVGLYLKRKASTFKDKGKETERIFRVYVSPFVGKKPVAEITRQDVADCLDRLLMRGKYRQCNIVLQKIKALYNWGLDVGLIDCHNPAYRMKKPAKDKECSRVLSDDEIRQLWSQPPHFQSAQVMKLILLTAARPGECNIKNKIIVGRWWTIPASDSKTDVAHTLYLTRQAKYLALSLTPTASTSVIANAAQRIQGEAQDKWTPHDLRRTVASRLVAMGYAPDLVDRLLNHAVGKIRRTYQVYDYSKEIREMLVVWQKSLKKILRST